ncbi:MAG TPA: STAS domain-containing protein [Acidimicrobiales bacterium]|nr:STAS domain-containing protein [Acidimicrobiales bacterium]
MPGEVFSFEVVTTGDVQVVALRGELDVANADVVKGALLSAKARVVVVDLSALTFIDSSGLTAIVHGHNDLTARGCGFELRGASEDIRRVFELTGLTDLLVDR